MYIYKYVYVCMYVGVWVWVVGKIEYNFYNIQLVGFVLIIYLISSALSKLQICVASCLSTCLLLITAVSRHVVFTRCCMFQDLNPDVFPPENLTNSVADLTEESGISMDKFVPGSMKGSATAVWNTVKDLHLELILMHHRVCLKLAQIGPGIIYCIHIGPKCVSNWRKLDQV